jgi:Protein of unknown function (DUF3037)
MPDPARSTFSYTILRAVPRVERAEFINAGVVLFSSERRFLGARTGLDVARLAVLAPDSDSDEMQDELEAIRRVAAGEAGAGPIARLSKAERYHWLSSPTSTTIQRSESHTGLTTNPAATLDHLFRTMVMTPGARLPRHQGWDRASRLATAPTLVGRKIERVRRLYYTYQGDTNKLDGPIELTFEDGSVLLCDTAADWTLQFFGAAWKDPFGADLTPDERQYLERYGKWGAHDVTGQPPYSWLRDETVSQVIPQLNELLELSGLLIRTDNAVLDLQLWAGELRAFVRRG